MERLHRGSSKANDAKFVGWQKTTSGEEFPLYTITAEHHPSRGSTVSTETLKRFRLRIPRTPASIPFATRVGARVIRLWRWLIAGKRRREYPRG
jgi:hypothetical protein